MNGINHIRPREDALNYSKMSVDTLKYLCRVYDEGHFDIARDMSNVICRLVEDELPQAGIMRSIRFKSYTNAPNPLNLLMQPLASNFNVKIPEDISTQKIDLTHVPLLMNGTNSNAQSDLKFGKWWSGSVLIDGAFKGYNIPTDPNLIVPYPQRRHISRSLILELTRNRLGAHYDENIRSDTSLIEDKTFEGIVFYANFGDAYKISLLDNPEYFNFTNSRASSIIRHLAFEIIQSATTWY